MNLYQLLADVDRGHALRMVVLVVPIIFWLLIKGAKVPGPKEARPGRSS